MTLRLTLPVVLLLATVSVAAAQNHPRLGMYGICTGLGYPLLDAGGNQVPWAFDALARYHQIILPVNPITPYRPDITAALRARRPDIQLIAYVPGQNIWGAAAPDSHVHFPTRYRRLVDSLDAHLYNTNGEYQIYGRVNFAKRAGGRYVMAEAAADLFHEVVNGSGQWDGIFIDVLCSSIGFTQGPGETIDFVRAGYPTFAAFDAAWGAAVDTLGDRLRRLSGSNVLIMGNCAQGVNYNAFNGWMRENFPAQNGGDWYQNMFRDPGGYLGGDLRFLPPHNNYISTIPDGTGNEGQQYTAENARRVRYGLGSAALGDGYGMFNHGAPSESDMLYQFWWYDEYAVDLTTGASSTQLQDTGWLGLPLAAWHQMIWVGSQPDAVTNPGFESNVTSGWQFGGAGTRSHDVTTAAVGSASARIHVPTVGSVPWSTAFNSTGTIPVVTGGHYSATFWAKATSTRSITVVAAPASGGVASREIQIDAQWRQYQVALRPSASANVRLMFYLGQAAGDVWLDDCHLQAGSTSLYRRDFQNGIVLVNPSNSSLTVPLEREFRRITGQVDPFVNNGATVTQATVAASDALFLIGEDQIPPAPVLDLQTFTRPGSPPPAPPSSSRPRRP